MQGKLSHMSPLGGAILGKRKGDVIEIMAPKGKTKYTIKDVE
ncbi:MAG: GreA/GreB family elongation factor [bacterium]|nr:GreA/GreB family elongation factor [bacterium]